MCYTSKSCMSFAWGMLLQTWNVTLGFAAGYCSPGFCRISLDGASMGHVSNKSALYNDGGTQNSDHYSYFRKQQESTPQSYTHGLLMFDR